MWVRGSPRKSRSYVKGQGHDAKKRFLSFEILFLLSLYSITKVYDKGALAPYE